MLIMKGTLGILPYTKYKREAIGVKNHLKILQHPFMFEAIVRILSNKFILRSLRLMSPVVEMGQTPHPPLNIYLRKNCYLLYIKRKD